jgi:hypothetical protein
MPGDGPVRAFVSGIDTGHDVSSEVFYFEPVPADEVVAPVSSSFASSGH